MLWANRNGYFYVLDRVTGEFLSGTPFVKVNWASGLDAKGRPIADAAAAGLADLPRQPGRHQLVRAVLQPAHRPLLLLGLGELRHDLPARRGRPTSRARCSPVAASPWSPRCRARARPALPGRAGPKSRSSADAKATPER